MSGRLVGLTFIIAFGVAALWGLQTLLRVRH
jgi:hypothetical protein